MRATIIGLGFGLGLGLAAACGDGGIIVVDCTPGTITCECVNGSLCADGLTCVSGFCVEIGDTDGTNPSDGDGDPTATGDGDPGDDLVGRCQLLIDCVRDVTPEALSSYVTLYGPEGECYDIAGLTPEDCWNECDAIRESLADVYPDSTECGPPNCGNGKLDLDEMCDGEDGCTGTCRYTQAEAVDNDCSPVTQVGCDPDSERCVIRADGFESRFVCVDVPDNLTPVGLDEECRYDAECSYATNAVCVYRPDCSMDWGCCTNTCYLGDTDEGFDMCPPGTTCRSLDELYSEGTVWAAGADLIGMCGTG